MSTRASVVGRVCCITGLIVACAATAAPADEFFFRLHDPLSPKQGGYWTVHSGGHSVQLPGRGAGWSGRDASFLGRGLQSGFGRTFASPGGNFTNGGNAANGRGVSARDPLERYRDVDGLYYLPPPARRTASGQKYHLSDYGFSSTLPSVWRRNFTTPRTRSARGPRVPQVR